jgi:hypothetical protein
LNLTRALISWCLPVSRAGSAAAVVMSGIGSAPMPPLPGERDLLSHLISVDFGNLTVVLRDILSQLARANERCLRLEQDSAEKNRQILVLFDRLALMDTALNSVTVKAAGLTDTMGARDAAARDAAAMVADFKTEWGDRARAIASLEGRVTAVETACKTAESTVHAPVQAKLDAQEKVRTPDPHFATSHATSPTLSLVPRGGVPACAAAVGVAGRHCG